MKGLLGNGEVFGGRMESGLMGSGLVRNKPSENLFIPIDYVTPDPYKDNVVLFIKGDGTNNSTNIIDSSPTPKTITRFGDTKISTVQSKYRGSSIYFDGIGDYLAIADSTDWLIDSNDFTIEFWVYPLNNGNLNYLVAQWLDGGGTERNFSIGATTWYINRNGTNYGGSYTLTLNTWQHIALTIYGNTARFFKNGMQQGQSITLPVGANNSNQPLGIGAYGNGTFPINAYIDSFRITKGDDTTRYITNFNPETDTYLDY